MAWGPRSWSAAGRSCWYSSAWARQASLGRTGLTLTPCRWAKDSCWVSPALCLPGLFRVLPRGTRGLRGTMLLWDVLGPSYNLALKRNCGVCQEHCKSCSLIWSGNFSAWRKRGTSKQTSHRGGQICNCAGTRCPARIVLLPSVCGCLAARLSALPSMAGVLLCCAALLRCSGQIIKSTPCRHEGHSELWGMLRALRPPPLPAPS